ncbi:hypothetical protein [Povalibacter sp.]|uniref:hypothetical protein n=1 Tax=Povalibacter sp. TaxID=1962978 RepID=UPI002F41AA03
MTINLKASLLLAMVALFAGPIADADTPAAVDEIKAAVTPGEIALTGSETKTIHKGSEAKKYRICVKTEKDAAP